MLTQFSCCIAGTGKPIKVSRKIRVSLAEDMLGNVFEYTCK